MICLERKTKSDPRLGLGFFVDSGLRVVEDNFILYENKEAT